MFKFLLLFSLLYNVSCILFSSFVFSSFVIGYICTLFIKQLMPLYVCLGGIIHLVQIT
jgi:hypothetical protein